MKPELEKIMHTQDTVYDGIRNLQEKNEQAATLVWWLHVANNDMAALRVIADPDLLQMDGTVKTLAEQLANEPTVLALTKELHEYEIRYPEGREGALWMRTEIGVRALMGTPWVKGLVDLGR